jgi:predicted AlkP superfamily phosphohydrolase/phosphomutase
MNYAVTLHLNLRGRDPLGTVGDRSEALSGLRRDLLAWEVDGVRVVERLVDGREVYGGLPGAPDALAELTCPGGWSWTVLPSARVPPGTFHRRLEGADLAGGKGRGTSGSHRPEGVLLMAGEGIRSGVRVDAEVADIAPTLLRLAGEDIPLHMTGVVLDEALLECPVGRRSAAQAASVLPGAGGGLRSRLGALGYV